TLSLTTRKSCIKGSQCGCFAGKLCARMREHLTRVLELAKPYKGRLILGLLCGFLSGVLAPTLGLSLKLAVDAVFPMDRTTAAATDNGIASRAEVSGQANPKAETAKGEAQSMPSKKMLSRIPTSLQRALDRAASWFRPAGPSSRLRLLLVISFIPAAMFV